MNWYSRNISRFTNLFRRQPTVYETDKDGQPVFWGVVGGGYQFAEGNADEFLQNAYGGNAYVSMVVDKVANKTSALPFVIVNKNGDIVENSQTEEFFSLLSEGKGFRDFMFKSSVFLNVTGDLFIEKIKPIGFEEVSLDIWNTGDVEIITKDGTEWGAIDYFMVDYRKERITPENVIHLQYPNTIVNTNWGLSPLMAAIPVYEASNNEFNAEACLHRNLGANGIISKEVGESAIPMNSEEQNRIQQYFNSIASGIRNFGKTVATRASVKYTPIAMDAGKLKTLELNEKNLRIISAVYSLDSKIFGDPSASTFNNLAEAKVSAYEDSYVPHGNFIGEGLAMALFDEFGLTGHKMVVDEKQIPILNKRDYDAESKKIQNIISIQNQIYEGKISKEQGVNMLTDVCGMSEDSANGVLTESQNEGREQE